jgi:hypothetical protein
MDLFAVMLDSSNAQESRFQRCAVGDTHIPGTMPQAAMRRAFGAVNT